MGTTLDPIMGLLRLDHGGSPALEPGYSAGLSDGFGDRLVFASGSGATTSELLRIRPELGDAPGFEDALRASVEALGCLHPALATIRTAERIEELGGLVLVSAHQSGRRLSEVMSHASSVALAVALITEVGPALAVLHQIEHVHGALTADRIVVSADGRLIVLEHVFGAALGRLAPSADHLRLVAGIAAPDLPHDRVKIDARLDVIQLGFIALALATGQRLKPSDYPRHVGVILDHFSRVSPEVAADFRPWLERALQVGDRPFADAAEACAAARELPRALSQINDALPTDVPAYTISDPELPTHDESMAALGTAAAAEADAAKGPNLDAGHAAVPGGRFRQLLASAMSGQSPRARRMLTAIGAVMLAQVAVIAYVILRGGSVDISAGTTPTPTWTDGRFEQVEASRPSEAALTASPPDVEDSRPPLRPQRSDSPARRDDDAAQPPSTPVATLPDQPATPPGAVTTPPDPVTTPPPAPSPPAPEPGTIEIRSPIELQVLDRGTVVGSTSGPMSLPPGTYSLELVNDELGFRDRQAVSVASGEAISLTVSIPNGRVDINAVPWADLWLDGVAIGQTPLANLSVPIGRHEVVFRHPDLGERRETVVVKAEGIVRVSAIFQR